MILNPMCIKKSQTFPRIFSRNNHLLQCITFYQGYLIVVAPMIFGSKINGVKHIPWKSFTKICNLWTIWPLIQLITIFKNASGSIGISLLKESRVTLACLYRGLGRFYMLQFISVDSKHFTQQFYIFQVYSVCLVPRFSAVNRVYVNKHTWVVGLRPTDLQWSDLVYVNMNN